MATTQASALNAELKGCPGSAIRFFRTWRRIELPERTRLFKFTHHTLFANGQTTPWWALAEPQIGLGDHGFEGVLAEIRKSRQPAAEVVRNAFAVMFDWNMLTLPSLGLLRVQFARLLQPVVAFHGPAAPVAGNRPPLAFGPTGKLFPGGAMQLHIPNLSGATLIGDGLLLLN